VAIGQLGVQMGTQKKYPLMPYKRTAFRFERNTVKSDHESSFICEIVGVCCKNVIYMQ